MKTVLLIVASLFLSCALPAQKQTTFRPATEWPDTEGKHINAHGGGILKKGKVYYWYGENRPDAGGSMNTGISVYTSRDLMKYLRIRLVPYSRVVSWSVPRWYTTRRPVSM